MPSEDIHKNDTDSCNTNTLMQELDTAIQDIAESNSKQPKKEKSSSIQSDNEICEAHNPKNPSTPDETKKKKKNKNEKSKKKNRNMLSAKNLFKN